MGSPISYNSKREGQRQWLDRERQRDSETARQRDTRKLRNSDDKLLYVHFCVRLQEKKERKWGLLMEKQEHENNGRTQTRT